MVITNTLLVVILIFNIVAFISLYILLSGKDNNNNDKEDKEDNNNQEIALNKEFKLMEDYFRESQILAEERTKTERKYEKLKEEKDNQLISFEDLTVGSLCIIADSIIMKTEYRNNNGDIKAFIVGSGEYFHCRDNNILVKPIDHLKLL